MLHILSDKKKEQFCLSQKNTIQEVLFESYLNGKISGWTKNYIRFCSNGVMNLDNKIKIINNPPREDVLSAYNESKFLVLPSRWELSPLTPLEGFAFKKTTISTKAHGIPYTLHDNNDSILVEPENFEELSHVIVELLNDKIKCERLGMQGYEFVHDECNSKEMARKILNVYEKIVK